MSSKYPLTPEDILTNRSKSMRYYYRNKDEKLKKERELILCDKCDCWISKGSLYLHKKTNKHKHYMVEKLIKKFHELENME